MLEITQNGTTYYFEQAPPAFEVMFTSSMHADGSRCATDGPYFECSPRGTYEELVELQDAPNPLVGPILVAAMVLGLITISSLKYVGGLFDQIEALKAKRSKK